MTKQPAPDAPSREVTELALKDWHRVVPLQFWMEVDGAPQLGSAAERAERLVSILKEKPCAFSDHILRALALDLMCASFPSDHAPPEALVSLMKRALGFSEKHEVGGWMLNHVDNDGRIKDRRGNPDVEAWMAATIIEREHIRANGKPISLRKLLKEVKLRLPGYSANSTTTLRDWRREPDYQKLAELPEPEAEAEKAKRDTRKRRFV
jgi:hypothetical protein